MSNIKNWVLAARPKTMLASVGPVIVGLGVAFHETSKLNTTIAALTLICAMLLQIATNIANDYLDFKKGVDTDKRIGPVRVTSKGLIPDYQMRNALILLLALSFLCGVYLMISGGPIIVLIGILSIYFSYGYTGGPYPLSYNALGEVAAFIFFGPIAVMGTTYLQTHAFSNLSLIFGCSVGLISAAILAINNLRDIESDKETKKKTIAILYGENFQRKLIFTLAFSAALISLIVGFYLRNFILPINLIVFLIFSSAWKKVLFAPIGPDLNNQLARTAQYLLLHSIVITIALSFFK